MLKVTIKRLFTVGLVSNISVVKEDRSGAQFVILVFNKGLMPMIVYLEGEFTTGNELSVEQLKTGYITPDDDVLRFEDNIECLLTQSEILDIIL